MNFFEAKKELLLFLKRPMQFTTQGQRVGDLTWEHLAGGAINHSIARAQRVFPKLNFLILTTGCFEITLSDSQEFLLEQQLRNANLIDSDTLINNVVAVSEGSQEFDHLEGRPLTVMPISDFLEKRKSFQDLNKGSFESFVKEAYHRIAVISGSGGLTADSTVLTLYPKPSASVYLDVAFTYWLPRLVEDNDTNIFLTKCWDYVLYASLKRMNMYLQEDERILINASLLREAEQELHNWNSALVTSAPIYIQ